jgi:hypothetical protein
MCPSVCTEQLGSHYMDFHKIWYLSIFQISVMKIQVSLISDKNNGYFTWRPIYIFYHILLNSSLNEKYFRQLLQRKSKHTFYVQELVFQNHAIYEIMWKNIVKPGRPKMTHFTLRTKGQKPTLLEYVTLIALQLLQWLHECNWNINQDRQCTLTLKTLN